MPVCYPPLAHRLSLIGNQVILCLHLFARRFKAIIIHSPETALSALKNVVLTKMPYHSAEFPLMDRVRVLYFGRIEAYKNLRYLVGIASRTSDTTDYFIAGSGDIEPELMKQIRGSPNVSLINSYVDGRTIKLLFDWCDYLILPYSDVTQTGLVDQAGYFAKPVILSNIDGFKPYLGKKFCVALDLNNLDSATERVQKLPVRTSLEYREMAMDSQLNYESSVGAWSDYVDLIVKIQ
ncbi:MAG: hypothetical protein IT515_09705 [Burkholderiales bacterium]|nr:hypothetical protein [Burkholderiales bacterium]